MIILANLSLGTFAEPSRAKYWQNATDLQLNYVRLFPMIDLQNDI